MDQQACMKYALETGRLARPTGQRDEDRKQRPAPVHAPPALTPERALPEREELSKTHEGRCARRRIQTVSASLANTGTARPSKKLFACRALIAPNIVLASLTGAEPTSTDRVAQWRSERSIPECDEVGRSAAK